MRALLDTNVVIDVLTEWQPFYEDASAIFDLAGGEYFNAYLTSNTLTDIYYLWGTGNQEAYFKSF